MDVPATLIPDTEPPVLVQPGQRSLHHPSVPPQAVARLDPRPAIRGVIPRTRSARRFAREL